MKIIHIRWDGPTSFDSLKELTDESHDYGVYQIYGEHPIYGPEQLLYIGKAAKQTFGLRIGQEGWDDSEDYRNMSVYVGRLVGPQPSRNQEWEDLIAVAERLLIYAHAPAYNAQCVSNPPPSGVEDFHVMNFGRFRALAAEVSGLRWSRTEKWVQEQKLFLYD